MSTTTATHDTAPRPAASPPKAPLAFRVGVVGHRPDRLAGADIDVLAGVIRAVLAAVKDEAEAVGRDCSDHYDSTAIALRAITPLAEGCDRIFAEQALALGYAIGCVTPFPRAELERDFADGTPNGAQSLERFRGILERARKETGLTLFEMDGRRADESAAYSAAGRVVLNQSDLLVVVWDGCRHNHRGGTEETFDEARRRGVTAVWIDAHRPHAWQLIDPETALPLAPENGRVSPVGPGPFEELRRWVRESLVVPRKPEGATPAVGGFFAAARRRARNAFDGLLRTSGADRSDDPGANVAQFYKERQPARSFAVFWKLFRDAIVDVWIRPPRFTVAPFERSTESEWPADPSTPVGRLSALLLPYYAWPDKLAILLSDRYRSAYVVAFGLSAVAVGLALVPVGFGLPPDRPGQVLFAGAELAVIVVILGIVLAGQHWRWHERWIDYRLAAELVRHLRLVAPLGGARPFPQVPAHWATYGQPGATWMAWYVRAVERALGLPDAVVDKAYLDEYLRQLCELLGGDSGQIAYHATTKTRAHAIETRLHRCGIVLLFLTIAACAMHLLPGIWPGLHLPAWLPPHVLTFACGFFPALGAAMQGIVHQGEFRRVAKRSESMQSQLDRLLKETEALRREIAAAPPASPIQYSNRAGALAAEAARLLVSEVLDWRVVFLDQPLKTSG